MTTVTTKPKSAKAKPVAAFDFKVKDLSQAELGRKEIRLAEHEMPGLMALRQETVRLLIADDVVPEAVKQATCELAKFLQENDLTVGKDIENMKRIVVDVIEIEYQDQTTQSNVPTIINAILTGLGSFRVGSRGFGKIIKA